MGALLIYMYVRGSINMNACNPAAVRYITS